MPDQETLIKMATKTVPSFKWAIGGAGLLALAAIVVKWGLNPTALFLVAGVVLVLAMAFIALHWVTKLGANRTSAMAGFVAWSFLVMLVFSLGSVVSSATADWPWHLRSRIDESLKPASSPKRDNPLTGPSATVPSAGPQPFDTQVAATASPTASDNTPSKTFAPTMVPIPGSEPGEKPSVVNTPPDKPTPKPTDFRWSEEIRQHSVVRLGDELSDYAVYIGAATPSRIKPCILFKDPSKRIPGQIGNADSDTRTQILRAGGTIVREDSVKVSARWELKLNDFNYVMTIVPVGKFSADYAAVTIETASPHQ